MHFQESKMQDQQLPLNQLYSLDPPLEIVSDGKKYQLIEISTKYYNIQTKFKREPFFSRQQYCLISCKWIKRWKVYVGYNEVRNKLPLIKYFGSGRLPTANSDIVESKDFGSFKFLQTEDYLNVRVRSGLQEGVDYEFITKQMYETLQSCSDYDMIPIIRNVVKTNDGKKVQIELFKLNTLIMFNNLCKSIENSQGISKLLQVTFQYSHYAKVKDFSQNILKYIKEEGRKKKLCNLQNKEPLRLWLLPQDADKSLLFNSFQQGCRANPSFEYRLFLDAQLLQNDNTLAEYDFTDSSYIIAELRQQNRSWLFFNNKHILQSNCNFCKEKKQLKYICACKNASYCSTQCKQKAKFTHKSRCPNDAESQKEEHQLKLVQNSNKGGTGLRNLGNTCFMNSGLQCISHIKQLTQYFLENKYIEQINKENRLGTKGQLSTAYAKLIQNLWFGTESSFSPVQLKKAIGKYQPMFSGFNQHDSSELINFLLDGLHEDLNRIKQKPYVESKDYDNRPDKVVADEAWFNFLKRNQSIIVDLMYGQYKSVLDCPKCNNISVQFDPFLMVSLPIRDAKKKTIQITFIRNHMQEIKIVVQYQSQLKLKMDWAIEEVKLKLKLKAQSKLVAYSASISSCELIKGSAQLEELRRQSTYRTLYVRELIFDEDPSCDYRVFLTNVVAYSSTQQANRKPIMPGRLYFFNHSLTYKQVHHRIYSYYKQFYPVSNYQLDVINQESKNQPFRLLYVSNSYYSPCQNCEKTKCYGCSLQYNDDNFFPQNKLQNKIQIQLYWRINEKNIQQQMQQARCHQRQNTNKTNIGLKIEDCFDMFQEGEILGEQNAWYCPKCRQFVEAKKQMQIYRAPKVLILCLKRFKRKEYHTEKYNILVNYPVSGLNLSNYVINYELPEILIHSSDNNKQSKPVYDLIGVSNHMGSTGGGHYTAYCKDLTTQQWLQFDDSYVSKVKEIDNIVSETGYVLFYRRRQ